MITRANKSELMKLANFFVKSRGYSQSEALKIAWRNIKAKVAFSVGIVHFVFKKVTGEIREAFGTLKASYLPTTTGANRAEKYENQTYYDTEANGWRCFRKANLIQIVETNL